MVAKAICGGSFEKHIWPLHFLPMPHILLPMTTSTTFTPPKVGALFHVTKTFRPEAYLPYFPEGVTPKHVLAFCDYRPETPFSDTPVVHVLVIGRFWHKDYHYVTVENPILAIPVEYFA